MSGKKKRMYLLYDGRACGGFGTDEATVMCPADSLREAKGAAKDYGQCACYSYADEDGKDLTDERWEFDTDASGRVL